MVPEKWAPGKMVLEKMVPVKIVSEKNGPRGKWSPENWSPKIGPRKNGPQKIGPRETEKRKIAVWASSIVVCVCVWNVEMWSIYENPILDSKPKTRKQNQNTETKNRGVSVEYRGLCVECSDVINLWKPKTRQQIFLDSFSVLQFGAYVRSWRERQTSFCVCSGINW